MDLAHWVAGATGLLAGVMVGGAFAWRVSQQKAQARHQRLVANAREQMVASTQKLRTVNARLQADLEKERNSVQTQVASVQAERRADVARLEGQLRYAYAEIDRLNAATRGGTAQSGFSDTTSEASGFALTRPYSR
jgi:TolA-binding protein